MRFRSIGGVWNELWCARKKNDAHHSCETPNRCLPAATFTQHYEVLRAYVLVRAAASAARLGQGALMARGMAAWMKVAAELAGPAPALAATPRPAMVPPPARDALIQLMGEVVMTLIRRTA